MLESQIGIHRIAFPPLIAAYRHQIGTTSDYDVTDNKCDTTPSFSQFKSSIMSDTLYREDERLRTFCNWPLSFIDKNSLAQTGMYFTNECDKVKCYFCEVEIGQWEVTDNPVSEHIRWSPNCPLIRRRTTNNIPLDTEALNRALPPISYDVCGGSNGIDIRPASYSEGAIATSNASPTYFPDCPEYAIESARLRSFNEWPKNMKQKPEVLSEAGFFYTGIGDRVKCFSCGGGLKDWDVNDDPWEQHALWLSNCRYLKLVKGPIYINAVIAKFKQEPMLECSLPLKQLNITLGNCESQSNYNISHLHNPNSEVEPILGNTDFSQKIISNNDATRKIIPEEKLCKICYSDEYNTAFLPCGHVVACAKCASSVTKCPMCRKPFTDIMRVYFS